MVKDLVFALQLGLNIIGVFIFCLFLGVKLDTYFKTTPIFLLIMIGLAFVHVMKLLLGVGKHE